jgi:hypothetical protein
MCQVVFDSGMPGFCRVAAALFLLFFRAAEGHASLLFAHKSDIRKISLDRKGDTVTIVNNTRQQFNKILKTLVLDIFICYILVDTWVGIFRGGGGNYCFKPWKRYFRMYPHYPHHLSLILNLVKM